MTGQRREEEETEKVIGGVGGGRWRRDSQVGSH